MIVIQTKMKVLPKKCNKCKYSYLRYDDRFCAVSFINGMNRVCPHEYNEAKRNYEYGKPDWCPLREVESENYFTDMKDKLPPNVDVLETDTHGLHSYVVALRCGGLMEDPEIYYCDYQVIQADSEKEACERYDKINNCNFYYGHVIKQLS